ncbi:hypothetical protein F4859DRAFT_523609 [Xylaria cf. heliscus]|nr:hypothetical protein F4859DRAFT_523609 [Xylaria cf. heliscus]
MASLINIDAPGAYPTTPSNEEPTLQTQHNNLQNQGIHTDEASVDHGANPLTFSHEHSAQRAQFNQATPRSLGNDAKSRDYPSGDSGVSVDDSPSSRERGEGKPGFMTGTYSRVGTQAGESTQNGNYTYGDIPSQSPHGEDAMPANMAENLAAKTPQKTSAETTAVNPINKTSGNSRGDGHNTIRSGLRSSSKIAHNEPYWGDIPFGAGVYNGVTGHGSNESTTHQRSLHDQYGTAKNSGVYNGVTGHGSKRPTSPGSSRNDEGTSTDNVSHQQRAFPLVNNGSKATATTKPNDADEHKRDSRFKEGLSDAGAATAGGYVNKDTDGRAKTTDEKLTGEKPTQLGQRKQDATSQPHGHNIKETGNKNEGKERSLPYRPFGAAPVQDDTQEKTLDRQPLDTENDSRYQKKGDSNLGKYGTAATGVAGAGAAALGVNKYADRDTNKEHSPRLENKVSEDTTRDPVHTDVQSLDTETDNNKLTQKEDSSLGKYGAATAAAAVGAGAGAYGMNKHTSRNSTKEQSSAPETAMSSHKPTRNNTQPQPHSNMLPGDGDGDGASPAGIASTSVPVHQREDGCRPGASPARRGNVPSDGTATGIDETRRSSSSSSDSSHGGKYNVLASGTPSGINLEQARAEKKRRRHEQQQQRQQQQQQQQQQQPPTSSHNTAFLNNPPSLPPPPPPSSHIQGAGNNRDAAFTPDHKVTHKCTKCGEENDISQYMMI